MENRGGAFSGGGPTPLKPHSQRGFPDFLAGLLQQLTQMELFRKGRHLIRCLKFPLARFFSHRLRSVAACWLS